MVCYSCHSRGSFICDKVFALSNITNLYIMKKLLLSLTLALTGAVAQAEYSAQNKTIEVVIPQSSTSGISQIFLAMQEYAEKQKISLVPVFKPGAAGKIGLDYAEKHSNNVNTILLTTVSDIAHNKAQDRFTPITTVTEVKLVLVASKKSNIRHISDIAKHPMDKFNWVYSSNAQLSLIDTVLKHYNFDKSKMNLISYTPGKGVPAIVSLISGDVDIGFVMPISSQQFIDSGQLTLVELDSSLETKFKSKPNAVAMFSPKNTTAASNKFWQEFTSTFLNDSAAKAKLDTLGLQPVPQGPVNLTKVLSSWSN